MSGFSFQTRARTIDHLGRGQIADSPTAISELWKNAFDAYARSVSLHIFGGKPPVACIFDDGKGMSADDLRSKWLVLGTESKTRDDPEDEDFRERVGLRKRVKQGEKGIGRLSVAFLAPATVLVTKKIDGGFAVVLVDWRLFENPYLSLSDIRLPVLEFETVGEIVPGIVAMTDVVLGNLGDGAKIEGEAREEEARRTHLAAAWKMFSEQERANGTSPTMEAIQSGWSKPPITERLLEEWPVYLGLADHGTALIMIDVQHDLAVWVEPKVEGRGDELVKERLSKTLTAFTDPFIVEEKAGEARLQFDYEVIVQPDDVPQQILATNNVFGPDSFRSLEHHLEGSFDEMGVFTGQIVAFGKTFGQQTILPPTVFTNADRNSIGPFDFAVGTFELELKNTTHSQAMHASFGEPVAKYAGLALYRDGLRVMPYGRPDADFFGLEERRSMHAGRNFWAHRRTFGRVAFTRSGNPKLKDKAGREGLVDNRSKALLRMLVINVLLETARNYFGTDSPVRELEVPRLQAQFDARRKTAQKLEKRRRINVGNFIDERTPVLKGALSGLEKSTEQARDALSSRDRSLVALATVGYRDALVLRETLRPPPMPAGNALMEEEYRTYRDGYRTFLAGLEELGNLAVQVEATIGSSSPEETVQTAFHRNQSLLSAIVDGYTQNLSRRLAELKLRWEDNASEDRKRYWKAASGHMQTVSSLTDLTKVLNILDTLRSDIEDEIVDRYEPLLRSLRLLHDGFDLEGAASSLSDDMVELEDKVRDLYAVAQVGISVEIIGHELETLDAEVRRNLGRLPTDVKGMAAYRLAFDAHSALTEKLRFLSPLKIAGYRNRETIRGGEIADYVADFFEGSLAGNRIEFTATEAFRSIRISDLRSRIYPVFINLVNNAIFWVSRVTTRKVTLDFVDGLVIVSDTGPGVDPDDIERLFTLFYSRRMGGRGVGLYLSRVNLGVANHQIRYARPGDPILHDGANFIIEFKGIHTDD